jgi:uncharacterized protein DUF397
MSISIDQVTASQSGNCVEVARNRPGLWLSAIRRNPTGAGLVISREAWQFFMGKVRA